MANKVIVFNDVQSKKFLGNTILQKAKGTLTTEELEIISRLSIEVPHGINIESMTAYVSGKDKIVVDVEISNEIKGNNNETAVVYRNQEIILDYFRQDSYYKWHEIKEKCFDEEIPVVLMEYVNEVDYINNETDLEELSEQAGFDLDEGVIERFLSLNRAKVLLGMSVRLKRYKKQNAQNDRIVEILEKEILPDEKMIVDIFSDAEYYRNNIKNRIMTEIYSYLESDKKVKGVTARGTARIIAPEAVKALKNKIKSTKSYSIFAQYIASEMFSWNPESVLEIDSKEQVIACLRRINNRVQVVGLLTLPVNEIESFVDRNEDKIKEVIKELRESNGSVYE